MHAPPACTRLRPRMCVHPHRAIQDPEVSPIIRDCVAVLACYVPPPMILELLAPHIADGCEDLRSRAAALEVLAHVVRWGWSTSAGGVHARRWMLWGGQGTGGGAPLPQPLLAYRDAAGWGPPVWVCSAVVQQSSA